VKTFTGIMCNISFQLAQLRSTTAT